MFRSRFLVCALAAGLAFAAPGVRADGPKPVAVKSEKELQEAALALNTISSKEDQEKKLRELLSKPNKANTLAMVKAAVKMHEDAGEKTPFKFNGAIILGNAALLSKDYLSAEPFYKMCAEQALKLQSGTKLVQAYSGLIDMNWGKKDYEKVERVCQEFLEFDGGAEISNAKIGVMERQIMALVRQDKTTAAMEKVDALTGIDGIGWAFLELKAQVQREAGKPKDAVDTQLELIEKIGEQKMSKKEKTTNVRRANYILSSLYLDNNQTDKAIEVLKQLVKDSPDNATYNNDLGFIMADHDKEFEESEKLVRKALDLDKKEREKLLKDGKITEEEAKEKNAAYLDSLGWVLYKKKSYSEAKKYLIEASQDEEEGNHIEIWDHLADTHMALGEVKEAVEIWTKALKLDDVSKRDVERRKKVTEKLKAAKAKLGK